MRYYVTCAIGVIAVSFAAIFIRMADAHPTVIALMRMILATLFMGTAWFLWDRHWPEKSQWPYLMGAGLFLALHFYTWIASLSHTSVASSVVLVATQPLFVVVLSRILFQEQVTRKQVAGLSLCILGTIIIGYTDAGVLGETTIKGNLLALAGALFAALYWLVGRKVRATLSLLPYTTAVYGISALVLGVITLLSGLTLGSFALNNWVAFFGLAVVCTVMGHSSLNYAIGNLSASFISVVALGEPLGAALLAALLFRELPTGGQLTGGLLVLGGIAVFAMASRRKRETS